MVRTKDKTNVTLEMVAAEAGVSPSTVSRVLNQSAGVSLAKQKRVNDIIQKYKFQPNPLARSLAGGKTMSIGVLTQFVDSPFYAEALKGIEDTLTTQRYIPIFVSGHLDPAEEMQKIALLMQRKVDGMLVLSSLQSDEALYDLAEKIPVVVTGRETNGANIKSIDIDNHESGRLAASFLHKHGHRQIAVISGPQSQNDAVTRLRGILDEFGRLGIAVPNDSIVEGDFQEFGGFQAMTTLLDRGRRFSAVIACNDQMAYGANLALFRAGFRVPDDVSLLGFDNLKHSAFTLPPLTTVSQSSYEIGVVAAERLLELISGKVLSDPSEVEVRVITRESTRSIRI